MIAISLTQKKRRLRIKISLTLIKTTIIIRRMTLNIIVALARVQKLRIISNPRKQQSMPVKFMKNIHEKFDLLIIIFNSYLK